jgi:hypothetical protein
MLSASRRPMATAMRTITPGDWRSRTAWSRNCSGSSGSLRQAGPTALSWASSRLSLGSQSTQAPTGRVGERWHQTLRRQLLDALGALADLPSAQAAISGWVHACNHSRPRQSLAMATPASLFRPGTQPDLALVPDSLQGPLETTENHRCSYTRHN